MGRDPVRRSQEASGAGALHGSWPELVFPEGGNLSRNPQHDLNHNYHNIGTFTMAIQKQSTCACGQTQTLVYHGTGQRLLQTELGNPRPRLRKAASWMSIGRSKWSSLRLCHILPLFSTPRKTSLSHLSTTWGTIASKSSVATAISICCFFQLAKLPQAYWRSPCRSRCWSL